MNEAITFDEYLNESRPDRDTILTVARFIANRWVDFPTLDKIRQGIEASAPDEPGLISEVNSLDHDNDFLERAALTVLSVAWGDDRGLVKEAFIEAEGALLSTGATLLGTTALIVFGLWTWQSNGGESFHYQKTWRNSDGSFTTEERTERQAFPLDVPGIIRALKEQDDPTFRPNKDQIQQAQKVLVAAGYPIATDGLEGVHTDKAVADYQRAQNLPVTGRLDRATLKQLGVVL
jgi:hypothetical protein